MMKTAYFMYDFLSYCYNYLCRWSAKNKDQLSTVKPDGLFTPTTINEKTISIGAFMGLNLNKITILCRNIRSIIEGKFKRKNVRRNKSEPILDMAPLSITQDTYLRHKFNKSDFEVYKDAHHFITEINQLVGQLSSKTEDPLHPPPSISRIKK